MVPCSLQDPLTHEKDEDIQDPRFYTTMHIDFYRNVLKRRSSLYVLVFMFIILSLSLLYPKFWLLNTMCGARTLFEPCNNLSLLSLVACGSYQCYVSWLFVSDAMLLLCHLKCITCHMHHGYFMTLVLAPLRQGYICGSITIPHLCMSWHFRPIPI